MSPRGVAADPAALPFAAAATALLARWLPIHFAYRENALGIVSFTTERRYPLQQESFWLVFGAALFALVAWALSRAAPRAGVEPRVAAASEAFGAGALLAALLLPSPLAAVTVALGLAGAGLLQRSSGPPAARAPRADPSEAPPGPRGRLHNALFGLLVLALALLQTPGLFLHAWIVAHAIPDERLVYANFKFMGEAGQHLAWANALLHGGLHGRDFFCLYGPLYDWGLVGLWQLVGRSVPAWDLYWSLGRLLGWLALLLLAGRLLQRRWLVLLLPFLVPWVELRTGLALFALLCLVGWLQTRRRAWCTLAGVVGGTSLFYSQEFGAAILVAAAAGFGLRRDLRAVVLFAGGLVLATAPVLGYYAAHGALLPMLGDLVSYPRYMIAGYGKLPFPALAPQLPLPLDLTALGTPALRELRLGYAVPALYVAALLLLLRVGSLDPRRPLASLGGVLRSLGRDPARLALLLVALFGLVSFRSALGRSSLHRLHYALPAAAVLLVCACDRTLSLAGRGGAWRALALWRLAALAACALAAGFTESASPLADAVRSLRTASRAAGAGFHPVGSQQVLRVVRWVQLHSEPGEPVLFLPNNAAYYYLTDRPNPIRFVMGHQIVTQAHRDEVLADLRAQPPRLLVWDADALRVDGLSDELVFGRELLDWLDAHYVTSTRIGATEIRSWRGARDGPPS